MNGSTSICSSTSRGCTPHAEINSSPLEKLSSAISFKNQGYYQKAIDLFTPLAEDGDAWAQLELGHMYAGGLGVVQDFTKAFEYYEKSLSASRNNSFFEKAASYFSHITSLGWASVSEQATAYELLGLLHYYHRQDVITAMGFINQGAVKGDAPCCLRLSKMYEKYYPKTHGRFYWYGKFEACKENDDKNNVIDAFYCFRLARIYGYYKDLGNATHWLHRGQALEDADEAGEQA